MPRSSFSDGRSSDDWLSGQGLESKPRLMIARPEHMTCRQHATAYGTARPFLDCIPVLWRDLYPTDLDGHSQSLATPWFSVGGSIRERYLEFGCPEHHLDCIFVSVLDLIYSHVPRLPQLSDGSYFLIVSCAGDLGFRHAQLLCKHSYGDLMITLLP